MPCSFIHVQHKKIGVVLKVSIVFAAIVPLSDGPKLLIFRL